ncbi:MAG: hypothetical protein WCT02_01085 [Candidatus Paceibacterota bacterium]
MFHSIGRDSYLDWALIVAVSFLVTVALVIVGAVTFTNVGVRSQAKPTAVKTNAAASIDTVLLDKVLNSYDSRAASYTQTLKNYISPADPSI